MKLECNKLSRNDHFFNFKLNKECLFNLCNYRKLQRVGAVVQKNLTQTRQRQTTRHHLQHTSQVKGKSNASNSIYLRDIRIVRILSGAILGCCVREVITLGSSSIEVTLWIASWEVGTLVLDDLLKYIVKNRFGIIRVFDLWANTKNVSAFSDVVLNVIVCALIRKLGHFDSERKVTVRLNIVTYFSDANCSSRSKRSRLGGGKSLIQGRKTAA